MLEVPRYSRQNILRMEQNTSQICGVEPAPHPRPSGEHKLATWYLTCMRHCLKQNFLGLPGSYSDEDASVTEHEQNF